MGNRAPGFLVFFLLLAAALWGCCRVEDVPSAGEEKSAGRETAQKNPEEGDPAGEEEPDPLVSRSVPQLIEGLCEENDNLRWYVVDELVSRGAAAVEPLIGALSHEDKNVRFAAAGALMKIGDERAVEPLLDRIHGQITDPEEDEHYDALDSLTELIGKFKVRDGRPVSVLSCALRDPDWRIRRLAADILGTCSARDAAAPLLFALNDGREEVCLEAAESLLELGDDSVIRELQIYLREGRSPKAKVTAAFCLLELTGGHDAQRFLEREYQNGTGEIRLHLARTLERSSKRKKTAGSLLLRALTDTAWDVRCAAARGSGRLGDKRAVAPLVELLRDGNANVVSAAYEALSKLTRAKLGAGYEEWKDWLGRNTGGDD